MAFSAIENKYLSALTAVQFPTEPMEPDTPEQTAPGRQPGDVMLAAGPNQTMTDGGAAFGIYPGMGKRSQKSNIGEKMITGAPDFAAGTVRGAATSALGFGGDIQKIGRFINALAFDNQGGGIMDKLSRAAETMADPTFLPSSTDVSEGGYTIPGTNFTLPGLPAAVPAGTSAFGMTPEERQGAGEIGQNVGELVGDPFMAVKGGQMAVRGVTEAGKALAPKAAEMTINALEKTGMPVRGLGIVEQAPQLAVERVPGVKPGDELIVQHNLTANNLLKADKLGGLPVPSLAISKVGAPLENFGEITLIAPREMASPSAKNPVFAADAYTKRFPTIDYQIDNKSQKTLKNLLSDVAEKIPGGDYQVDRLLDNWNDRQYSDILRAKFLDERGTLPNRADFAESWKFDSEVQTLVNDNYSEFTDWMTKFDDSLASNGVNVKERIFQGYTYSGNRRYAEVNLTNLVKEMKGGAGEEGWNYGVSSLRAVATPQFRKFSEIKAARDKIIDTKAMESVKDQTRQAYESLLGRLYDINGKYDAMDALREVVESKNVNSLDRNYDAPPELKADIGLFIQKLKTLPSQYFEIKPQRAVSLEEFKGAIIPKDTPQAAREVLNKAGITDIHEYSTPEERKGLFDKFGKEMFATMPAVPLGSATMQDKEKK